VQLRGVIFGFNVEKATSDLAAFDAVTIQEKDRVLSRNSNRPPLVNSNILLLVRERDMGEKT